VRPALPESAGVESGQVHNSDERAAHLLFVNLGDLAHRFPAGRQRAAAKFLLPGQLVGAGYGAGDGREHQDPAEGKLGEGRAGGRERTQRFDRFEAGLEIPAEKVFRGRTPALAIEGR